MTVTKNDIILKLSGGFMEKKEAKMRELVVPATNEDYATVQLGLGHEKFGVEILKEMEFEKGRNTFSKENKEQIRDMIRTEPQKNINMYGKMLYTKAFDKLKKNIVYQKNKNMSNTKKEENKKHIEKTGQEIVRR